VKTIFFILTLFLFFDIGLVHAEIYHVWDGDPVAGTTVEDELRNAIGVADDAGDTVVIHYENTISINSTLFVNGSITIIGSGPDKTILDGQNSYQIFDFSNGSIMILNLGFVNGYKDGNGGVFDLHPSVTSCYFYHCDFNSNSSTGYGGVGYIQGGVVDFKQCSFSGNSAATGGIFKVTGTTLTFNDCTVTGNSASNTAGAVYFEAGGSFYATNSTFTGNTSGWSGGAINFPGGSADFNNCTFTGNTATTGEGGAIHFASGSGGMTAKNCIVSANNASFGADIYAFSDVTISSNDYNYVGEAADDAPSNITATVFNQTNDITGNNTPGLGGLTDNGGFTLTMLPAGGSAVENQGCALTDSLDQRGYFVGASIRDIGSCSRGASTPAIQIRGNGTVISNDNTIAAAVADNRDFGDVATGSSQTNSFDIINMGNGVLYIGAVTITGPNAEEFEIVEYPDLDYHASMTGNDFNIQFSPLSFGDKVAYVNIENTDDADGSFSFKIEGAGIAPFITVDGNEVQIVSPDHTPAEEDGTDFGDVDINGSAVEHSFVINNEGNANLTIDSIILDNDGGGAVFTFGNTLSTPAVINSGSDTSFSILFNPVDTLNYSGDISIYCNDPTMPVFFYEIAGN